MKELGQLQLFPAIEEAYLEAGGELDQQTLYSTVAEKLGINPMDYYDGTGGKKGINHFYRKLRWLQQDMKNQKILRRVERGCWELIGTARNRLHAIKEGKSVIAMSTRMGVMICSRSESVFDNELINEEISLVITSPPYILNRARLYGGISEEKEWCEFIINVMKKIKPKLADGASIALQLGQDSFIQGMPARKTHIERLTLMMVDEGFFLCDRMVIETNKPPTPTEWACKKKLLLKAGYDFVLHFSTNPLKLMIDNSRVRIEHKDSYKKFVLSGGSRSTSITSDGAHRQKIGDYSKVDLSKGKIPSNVQYFSNKCKHGELVNRFARSIGVPIHGAKMTYQLAHFLIQYMCPVGKVAYDPFGGTCTVGEASEDLERKWIVSEMIMEYIQQSFIRFRKFGDDVWFNPSFLGDKYRLNF
ncbi:DNA methyltransferase [Vibrio harveyi]|uniref:DNA methyltransferase n=1 Tax=Vibrio harveyi TaxID=669 RepID=UPI0031BCA4FB